MNNDDIILLAIENTVSGLKFDEDGLIRFANLIAQHEREACARVCDDIHAKYKWPQDTAEKVASQWCADAIRARGQA